ncbi:VOC family protein [Micromonospora sp. CV4]|uniref:VOC family protein n=1 Tax=Micromonospora sp. CV4 TaxID=2478711 RepID=UPI000EF4D2A6|nr:VOC family protein [Micromonospora sp. CV4]RLP91640.1 VOC family protein [Micromonospora sp. CV4]
MAVRIAQCTIDVEDLDLMVSFWSAALGYEIERGDDGSAKLWPPGQPSASSPSFWLQGSGTAKRGKNRLHLDLVADGDPQAEVRRLVELGARHVDVGQSGTEQFTVLADPEGNEFCVLDSAPTR